MKEFKRVTKRLFRRKTTLAAACFLAIVTLAAIFAPFLTPYGPAEQDLLAVNAPPSWSHWLGQDDLGRDILTRLLYGARISLASSMLAVAAAVVIALPLGLLSGYLEGRVDTVIMRVVDGMQAIPPLVLALVIVGLLGPNLRNIVLALAVIFAPTFTRLIRGQVLAVKRETFIEASRSVGSSNPFIIRKRVLHNIASPLIVQVSIMLGFGLLAEAGLSFIGLGVAPPAASWGGMLGRGYAFIFDASWVVLPPGIAIVLTVLSFNVLGDGLRDSLGGR